MPLILLQDLSTCRIDVSVVPRFLGVVTRAFDLEESGNLVLFDGAVMYAPAECECGSL